MTIFAGMTDYTVHAEKGGDTSSGSSSFTYSLVDEGGNKLTDESGNYLVAPFVETVYGDVIYAPATDYTVHAEG